MTKRLSNENVPSRTILAYQYGEEELKQCILDFLDDDRKNVQSLMVSDEWIEFAVEDSDLRKKALADMFG